MGDDRNVYPDNLDDQDEAYFDSPPASDRPFDTRLLRESATHLPPRKPIVLGPAHTVTDAIRAMKGEHRGCVLITEDGTPAAAVVGIFTERDVLFRIVDGGRNPAVLSLGDVMTPEPECLEDGQTVAEVLNQMSVGGFRHVPAGHGGRRLVGGSQCQGRERGRDEQRGGDGDEFHGRTWVRGSGIRGTRPGWPTAEARVVPTARARTQLPHSQSVVSDGQSLSPPEVSRFATSRRENNENSEIGRPTGGLREMRTGGGLS